MLLWPPSKQTSPTRMFVSSIVSSLHRTVIVRESKLAGMAGSSTFQDLSAAAAADWVFSPKVTVVVSPAVAQPQIGIGLSRCTTMLDWKRL